ncbi:MAG TPA: hypothetical protein VKS21_07930 [Spirochaetota bacterium]|nr:hypothetical protein [Spirochaetota bacterium]
MLSADEQVVGFKAGTDPGICIIEATVVQGPKTAKAPAVITVTDSFKSSMGTDLIDGKSSSKGLPSYTFIKAPGELWRSRYNDVENLIEINKAHVVFVFASKIKKRRLQYICRLFCKELVLTNFQGIEAYKLLERLIELYLHAEANL